MNNFNSSISVRAILFIVMGLLLSRSLYSKDFDENPFSRSRSRYVITDTLDFNNQTVVLPKRSKLIFKGGMIKNAKLTLNMTKIISDDVCFGGNMSFNGSIRNRVCIEWFDIKYGQKIDNSSSINSALQLTSLSTSKELKLPLNKHVYVKAHQEEFVKLNGVDYLTSGNIQIPSGVTFNLNGSTIQALTNDCPQYAIVFSVNTENIVICNGVIRGDAESHVFNKGTHEWGYGIEFQGVSNFTIKDIICENCTGDGIDIQAFLHFDKRGQLKHISNCSNGVISNTICRQNGRNSMSIQGCNNLVVENCSFETASRTAPKAGIDIEPSISKGIVSNVIIRNCKFINNVSYGLLIHKIAESVCVKNIKIISSSFNSEDSNYHILNNGAYGLEIDDCVFASKVKTGYHIRNTNATNVSISSCSSPINGVRLQCDGVINDLDVSNTDISAFRIIRYPEHETEVKATLYSCYIRPDNDAYALLEHSIDLNSLDVTFLHCTFDYSECIFRNPQNTIFLVGNIPEIRYEFNNCKFIGNGANLNLTNSVNVQNSYLDNVKLTVLLKEDTPNKIIFTNNTIENFYVYPDNIAINLLNISKSTSAYLDFSDNHFETSINDSLLLFNSSQKNNLKIICNNTNIAFE